MMKNEIYRVALIVSDTVVVLNCGSNNGIEVGDKFLIYGIGEDVVNPETNEILEKLEIVKGVGKVIHIQDKICTLKTDKFIKKPSTITEKRRKSPSRALTLFPEEYTVIREVEEMQEIKFDNVNVGDYARFIE